MATNVRTLCLISLLVLPLSADVVRAQGVPRVTPGFGVDTTAAWSQTAWHSAVPEIWRAWREYLLGSPHLQQPTPLWSAAEQREWPAYDLTASFAYRGLGATILDIRPLEPHRPDMFAVQTLFATALDGGRDIRPIALTRVHAVRQDGRWVFTNVIHHLTREWRRVKVGDVSYVVAPGRTFDTAGAARAVAVADSLADALALPRVGELTYYVADDPEQLLGIMGVDWTVPGQGHGYATAQNRLILSGDPVFGEANVHELVHVVLAPILEERRTHGIINEGLATRLGGSVGRTLDELLAEYAAYLRTHRDITLDTVLESDGPDRGWRPAGAVLVLMVEQRGGAAAVGELLRGGRSNDELRSTLERLLDLPWPAVATQWRARIVAAMEG